MKANGLLMANGYMTVDIGTPTLPASGTFSAVLLVGSAQGHIGATSTTKRELAQNPPIKKEKRLA